MPAKNNLPKLTEKEEETMSLIWEYGPCKVKTIIEHMNEPKPHFNTISTYVGILEEKGYVGRMQSNGRGNLFYAKVPRNNYRSNLLKNMLNRFFGSGLSIVSQLIEDDELTPAQLSELSQMIEQAKSNTTNTDNKL